MPEYDFKCKKCGHQFTVRVQISERDKVRCPECDSEELSQVFSPKALFTIFNPSSSSSSGPTSGSCCQRK